MNSTGRPFKKSVGAVFLEYNERLNEHAHVKETTVGDLTQNLVKELRRALGVKKSKRQQVFDKFIYCWHHPFPRIFLAFTILTVDWYIFAEDPTDYSLADCWFPGIGAICNLFLPWRALGCDMIPHNDYHPQKGDCGSRHWMLMFAKVMVSLVAAFLAYKGATLLQVFLAEKLHYEAFQGTKGGVVVKIAGTVISVYGICIVWNFALSVLYGCQWQVPGEDGEPGIPICEHRGLEQISNNTMLQNKVFGKVTQTISWLGDVITLFCVIDLTLQDDSQYPRWAIISCEWISAACSRFVPCFNFPRTIDLRQLWMRSLNGRARIVVFWGTFLVTSIYGSYWLWRTDVFSYMDRHNLESRWWHLSGLHRSEFGRALASSILFLMDVCIVTQDWDFPTFSNPFQLKFLGTNLVFQGRWVNYGMMFWIMILDLNNLKNQVVYQPAWYGQYINTTANQPYIVVVMDPEYLRDNDMDDMMRYLNFENRSKADKGYKDRELLARYAGHFHGDSKLSNMLLVCLPIFVAIILLLGLKKGIKQSHEVLCNRVVVDYYNWQLYCKAGEDREDQIPQNVLQILEDTSEVALGTPSSAARRWNKVKRVVRFSLERMKCTMVGSSVADRNSLRGGGREVEGNGSEIPRSIDNVGFIELVQVGQLHHAEQVLDQVGENGSTHAPEANKAEYKLLLVTGAGVFEVTHSQDVCVGNLKDHLIAKNLVNGMDLNRIILKSGRGQYLQKSDLPLRDLSLPYYGGVIYTFASRLVNCAPESTPLEAQPARARANSAELERSSRTLNRTFEMDRPETFAGGVNVSKSSSSGTEMATITPGIPLLHSGRPEIRET